MDKDVIFFPWRDFDLMKREGFRTREANILLMLLENPKIERIICVNRFKLPKYLMRIFQSLKIYGLIDYEKNSSHTEENFFSEPIVLSKRIFSKVKQVHPKLFVVEINHYIPNKSNKLERFKFFKKRVEEEIRNVQKKLNIVEYTTWCYDLTRIQVATEVKSKILIFDAIDNLLEHDQMKSSRKYLQNMYGIVEHKANIIFSTSEDIIKNLFPNHKDAYYIPNGVSYKFYDNKTSKTPPSDLPSNDFPIVGYVGLLQERVDTDILIKAIKNNKNVNFIFIGPELNPHHFENIKRYSNVFFLGSKHHSEIPYYIEYFDVGIIPHKVNNFTKSMSPLKLYEYLASKKQVVTTPVPPSEEFEKFIHIATTSDEFSLKIQECLERPYQKFTKKDISSMIKNHEWKKRLDVMLEIIDNYH